MIDFLKEIGMEERSDSGASSLRPAERPDATVSREAEARVLEQAIEHICSSRHFRKSPALRELLTYLCTNTNKSVSEYAIGIDVLRRRPGFDPKTDATVRVQISRLRQKLREYYDSDGKDSLMRLSVPLGSHHVEVVQAPVPQTSGSESAQFDAKYFWMAIAIAGLLVAILSLDDWQLRKRLDNVRAVPETQAFWQPFLQSGNPVSIVVTAPLFFQWEGRRLVVRDFGVNTPEAYDHSPYLADLARKLGRPRMAQTYTVASDTLAAAAISRYLQDRGGKVGVVDTPTVPLDLLGSRDTVILVGPATTDQVSPMLEKTNFYLQPGTGAVFNRNPLPGEPPNWVQIQHAPLRATSYGIVAILSGQTPGRRHLVLASNYNLSLASALTSAESLGKIEELHKRNGSPPYFEVVIEYERNAETTLRVRPVAFRAIRISH